MTRESLERRRLLASYAEGCQDFLDGIATISPERLDLAPAGDWSARQIVHHMADTEAFRAVRLRLLLAEDNPTILAFDEAAQARSLHWERPIDSSLALFRAAFASSIEILQRLTPADWARKGTHTELGTFTMDDWLLRASTHAAEHTAQLQSLLHGMS